MADELAPRFELVAIIRTIFVFFGIFALINGHTYIGVLYDFSVVEAAFAVSWTAVVWNILCVTGVAIHPYLQRFAGSLPFPITVKVRDRTVLSYGDSNEDGDGFFAPLTGKLSLAILDIVLATLLLVFRILSQDKAVECWHCIDGYYYVQKWILNIWLTLVIFQYVLGLVQALEAFSIWYKSRYVNKRGQISLA
ncbi:hypothetical protein BJ170DRAFT_263295 [Xylariales sp. AK1849]|nr:hypothetical protein BJ170DRAFT_263295 [Xylariales sp. AK1849]